MKRWGIILALLLALLQNNCATITLVKTESDYQPVSPVKMRLGCNVEFPKEKIEPVIALNLMTEKLYQRQNTKHYKTSYAWRNRLVCLGFAGLCLGAAINWWDEQAEYQQIKDSDTTIGVWYPARVFGLLGAGLSVLELIFAPDIGPFQPKYWHKTEPIVTDTLFKDPQPLSKKPIVVKELNEPKTHPYQTDEKGKAFIDIRDFYTPTAGISELVLRIGYENFSTQITVPSNYVKQVRDYEDGAKNLFAKAETEEEKGKYEEALADYKMITEKYPLAKVSKEAEAKVAIVENKIVEKKIAEIRKRLQRVSDEKVRSAIGKLGLDEYQSNAFANAIENLPEDAAVRVMKDGLGMPLSEEECFAEYRKLTRFQKFYAVVCYKDNLEKESEKRISSYTSEGYSYEEAYESIHEAIISELRELCNISYDAASILYGISPKSLLR